MKQVPLILVLAATATYAQAPQPVDNKPPVIPQEMMKNYYHSLANKLNAQVMVQSTPQFKALDAAQEQLGLITTQISQFCTDKYTIVNDPNGDPRCVDKPATPAAPAPPPAAPGAPSTTPTPPVMKTPHKTPKVSK